MQLVELDLGGVDCIRCRSSVLLVSLGPFVCLPGHIWTILLRQRRLQLLESLDHRTRNATNGN